MFCCKIFHKHHWSESLLTVKTFVYLELTIAELKLVVKLTKCILLHWVSLQNTQLFVQVADLWFEWQSEKVGKKHMFIFGANIAAALISCLGSLSLIWNKNMC